MADWLDSIEARNKAQAKYDKAHTAGFYMKLNTRTDSDIIHWLWGQPSRQGAIKKLIRDEIARKSAGLSCYPEKGPVHPFPASCGDGSGQSPGNGSRDGSLHGRLPQIRQLPDLRHFPHSLRMIRVGIFRGSTAAVFQKISVEAPQGCKAAV